MTQDELDALPEYTRIDYEVINLPDKRYPGRKGDTLRIPILKKGYVMSYSEDDYAMIEDREGRIWTTGDINGVKHKQRAMI